MILRGMVNTNISSGRWKSGEGIASDVPGRRLGWAGRGLVLRVVVAITGWVGGGFVGLLQGSEILVWGDGVAVDCDETVAISFLRVLVDETTGVAHGHLSVVESRNFLELATVGDAAIFGEAVKTC